MASPRPVRTFRKQNRAPRARRPLHQAVEPSTLPAPRETAQSPEEAISKRAYEIYLERGCDNSDSLGDWLQAEREYWFRLGQPAKARWRGPYSPTA